MRPTIAAQAVIASVLALGAFACGGAVANQGAPPVDGGPIVVDGSPVDAHPISDGGPGPDSSFDSGPGPTDSGPVPTPDGDTCQSPGVDCTTPPSSPTGPTSAPTPAVHNYAFRQLYMGDTDRTGITSVEAWASYGYNLDNLVTTKSSNDVCTLAAGASKTTQVDGTGGIDNSFGANILPIIITTAGSDFSTTLDASIQSGAFTDLVYTVGFDDTAGNTTSATGLTGMMVGGGDYATANGGAAPAWNLTTHWPIRPETLNGCPNGVCPAGTNPITAAIIQFPAAYQADGLWVNGTPAASLTLPLSVNGQGLPLQIHGAIVTFSPKTPGSVTNGTVAGVLATTEFIAALQTVAGSISTSLCSGSAFDSIAQQIEQASDIVYDPSSGAITNQAGVACNAISIGLGFDATEVAPPVSADITGPTPASPNPCGDQ